MQELRLVLIIVGGLAIAGLLVHGIWTSKKEGKAKFADKPLNKMEPKVNAPLADDAEEGIVSHAKPAKERKEPAFYVQPEEDVDPEDDDPLFGRSGSSSNNHFSATEDDVDDVPLTETRNEVFAEPQAKQPLSRESVVDKAQSEPIKPATPYQSVTEPKSSMTEPQPSVEEPKQTVSEPKAEPKKQEMEVIAFHVHAAGNSEFVGTELFESMRQNGLIYGAMDIFHRHTDTSGTGKVLFSVANMMNPGTLAHDDPATFHTKGISFFMTLPCFGNPDQNFKLMLRTAQQIADDLGANVLDEKRNLMTPDRLSAYRQQIRDFVARSEQVE